MGESQDSLKTPKKALSMIKKKKKKKVVYLVVYLP